MSHQEPLSPHRRARAASDKDRRRADLLAAAREAALEQPIQALRLADVAARVGLSKASVYRYFPTKEALLDALLLDELAGWFTELAALDTDSPEALGDAVARSVGARPVMRRLYAALHGVLEHTADVETVLRFKRQLLAFAVAAAAALPARCPWLPEAAALPLLLQLHVVLVGLCEGASVAPAVEAAFAAEPALRALHVDLVPTCAAMVGAIARAAALTGEPP